MPHKNKKSDGLGKAILNSRFGGKVKSTTSGKGSIARRRNGDGSERYTTETKEASWVKMRSITEQAALDEFLSTAALADTDFTAEKLNIRVIHPDQKNPYLLSATDEATTLKKHRENAGKLTVPRRPSWDENTTPAELERMEKDGFLDWRRSLAELQENNDLLMTPFERNVEVWRQLWRVIERSDLVVQIVDARNPLCFRSEDLEKYVKEINEEKRNLLLVNKADMMTVRQRQAWADYFDREGIDFKFFSATMAAAREDDEDDDDDDEYTTTEGEESEDEQDETVEEKVTKKDEEEKKDIAEKVEALNISEQKKEEKEEQNDNDGDDQEDPHTRILTVDELEQVFLDYAPDFEQTDPENPRKINIGLVGYPNVGKSSTINALIGAKKVSVSATPGKTKHFQTIHFSPKVMLVDCPGLVFPNFATTKAELVCNGVLPIDQLREFTGPAELVAQRIPKQFIEAVYGIKIITRPVEEGGSSMPTASEVLRAYARARGFSTTGTGKNWDESRAARYVLKDYVSGKLLYVHPPPSSSSSSTEEIDGLEFNKELYDISHLPARRRYAASTPSVFSAPTTGSVLDAEMLPLVPAERSEKASNLDANFFKAASSQGHAKTPFQYVSGARTVGDGGGGGGGKELSGRKAKMMAAMDMGISAAELKSGKKHFKQKREKRRTNALDD